MSNPRKPHRFGGLQVRICGHLIQKEFSVVCQRLPDKHSTHTGIATNDEGTKIYAFIKYGNNSDAEVKAWQLHGDVE